MKKKKLCFVNSCRVWGGGERWHLDLARALAGRGHAVTLFADDRGELYRRAVSEGLPAVKTRIGNASFLNPATLLGLARTFSRERFDAVLLNLPADVKCAGIAARLAGNSRILYRRGSAITVRGTAFNRYLYGSVVDDVIANSEETKRTIRARLGDAVPEDKIRVIYNGIDLKAFDSRDRTPLYRRRENETVLGHAGRLAEQKDQGALLDLAVRLRERDLPFRLLIAGEGPLAGTLAARARRLGIDREVRFLGFVREMRAFYESIDLFLLPSLWEGFGYVLVEAMAAGRPVVAVDRSSNPEVVESGRTGLLAQPGDPADFEEKTVCLMEDPARRRRMGGRGRQRAEEMFTLSRTVEKVEELLALPGRRGTL